MKWYAWLNWLGVFFFLAFVVAIYTTPWVLLGFFLGAVGMGVEMYVQNRINSGAANLVPKEKPQPEPTWEELYSNLEDVDEPAFPLMPTPEPKEEADNASAWLFTVESNVNIIHEDAFPDLPAKTSLREAVDYLRQSYHTLDGMSRDFFFLDGAELLLEREGADGSYDAVWLTEYLKPLNKPEWNDDGTSTA